MNINLDDYNVQKLVRQQYNVAHENSPEFYPNIFDYYANQELQLEGMSFPHFWKIHKINTNQIIPTNKRTLVLTYPQSQNWKMSQYYHLYWKYSLIKQKPWMDSVKNAWGGPIIDPLSDDTKKTCYDSHEIVRKWYIDKFKYFCEVVDIAQLEMSNSDFDRLCRTR